MTPVPYATWTRLRSTVEQAGGIGGDNCVDAEGCPLCLYGFIGELHGTARVPAKSSNAIAMIWMFERAGVDCTTNDAAVMAINARLGRDPYERVPFSDWLEEIGSEHFEGA